MNKKDVIQSMIGDIRSLIEEMAAIDPTDAIFYDPVTAEPTGEDDDLRREIVRIVTDAARAVNDLELALSADPESGRIVYPAGYSPSTAPQPKTATTDLVLFEDVISLSTRQEQLEVLVKALDRAANGRLRITLTPDDEKALTLALGMRMRAMVAR